MLQFEECNATLQGLVPALEHLKQALAIDALPPKIDALEAEMADPSFWENQEASQRVLKDISRMKGIQSRYDTLRTLFEEIQTLIDMGNEEEDLSILPEVTESLDKLAAELKAQTLSTLLTGEYDAKNAILTFHAGAGGTEAQDWAQMLYRMYTRFAERRGFRYQILDYLDGEEAGLKSASILITGENAYGFLRGESGVHRLVRISPFDSSGRRHTSFASLEVMPEIDDTIVIDISDDDLRIDTYRSGGAGGQHVNKTDSAVRITHLPTGVVTACQNERSQRQNKETAMKMLKSKLIEIKEREHLDKIEDIKGEHKEIGWGSQIRSYVFMPYTLAKDHRTGFENGNINAVMDGDLDGFINAYLTAEATAEV